VKSDPTIWLLARASGITAYVLLTSVVLAGLLLKARPFGARPRPAAVTDIHRFLSLLALAALALHGAALVLDRAVSVPLQALLVPGIAEYRPLWTGLGVVAGELMLMLVLSFSVRRRIGARAWRRFHYAAYAAFAAAAVHGIMAGSDSGLAWMRALYISSIAAVIAATAWRILASPIRPTRPTPRLGGTNDQLSHPDRPVAV
jgi:DMSO/TMAO reductase YedYZ heme-binding membrane subunit